MNYPKNRSQVLTALLVVAAMAACDGSTPVGEAGGAGRAELLNVQVGRLVDVYSYQRVDSTDGDRRNRFNRRLKKVEANVAINGNIDSQVLFDAAGAAIPTANYEFLPFDKSVGHEELVILWDNENPAEAENFKNALAAAQTGLPELGAAFRGQPSSRPIPVVPRNAAIVLNFSNALTVDEGFFRANPGAIQLLEFKSDPLSTSQASDLFRVLPSRLIPRGNQLVIDTTVLGGESQGISTPGLPLSADNVTANIRVAIPSRGSLVSSFYAKEDPIAQQNGPDSSGLSAVIRDFRSGNLADGVAGRLAEPEAPMIVGSLGMGITAVDAANRTLTINKRFQFVPVRGRYPFVDGPLGADGRPRGPLAVPTTRALRSGDILTQVVDVNGLPVTLRAEVLQNLDVGTVLGDPLLPRLGLVEDPQGGSDQGEARTTARVRVAMLSTVLDGAGKPVFFQASTNPLGKDCILRTRYYEDVPFVGSSSISVTDRAWRHYFVRIDPQPVGSATPGTDVQPNAAVAIEFTKPMDLDQVDNTLNFLITNRSIGQESFATQMTDPKRATTRVVPTRLSDVAGDGTILRLQPPMGFFHVPNQTETYCVHVRLGTAGVTDLSGKRLEIFDRASNPLDSWSVDFSLAAGGAENRVGWHSWIFQAEDEDGSLPGSVDIFGQYRIENGRLFGANAARFSRSADNQNLGTISRIHRGECWDSATNDPAPLLPIFPAVLPPPTAPFINGVIHPGQLYWQPKMSDIINPPFVPPPFEYYQTAPQPVGRVIEPHKSQGSRMQMRYIEDDFTLDYRQPSDFAIDVEQLYWSPFNDETVLYDVFDRYTMSLAHSRRRPDERFELINGNCFMIGACMNSSLSETFSENILQGTTPLAVLQDKIYDVNPNRAFRVPSTNVKYVPYPDFDRTYTWRDSRLVTVNALGEVIGLGGAQEPGAQAPNDDVTANIDSPWILSNADPEFLAAGFQTWVEDPADFRGELQRDHDPIALPLLVDIKVFADTAANGLAGGFNGFQVAMLGPPSNFANPAGPIPGGYYDAQGSGFAGRPAWPRLRVHASGGEDLVNGSNITIDPANQLVAQGSSTKDAGLGTTNPNRALFVAPSGDGMLHWARADFVRKISTMTFGFLDTLQPQRANLVDFSTGVATASSGFPDLVAIDPTPATPISRISDMVVQMDPPQARQPAGTSVVVELRGADSFDNDNNLYNPAFDGTSSNGSAITRDDTFAGRGNLLNPNYACEAYRYSTANLTDGTARVPAAGLTKYVTEDKLSQIRSPATGLLPRFMNLRLVMTNNVDVSPALSPSLRSLSVVYRVQAPQ